MSSIFKRYPRTFFCLIYAFVLLIIVGYYEWQLTRDNKQVGIFEYEGNGGGYVDLANAFLEGHVYILWPPDPRFANLKNPYSDVERGDIPYPYDFSYYRAPGETLGKFYLYFGAVPVLLFYIPTHWITGALPSEHWVMFLQCCLSLIFYVFFVRLLVRNYFPQVPLRLEVLLLFMFALCNMNNFLQVNPNTYQLTICSDTTFTLGCFVFLLLGLEKKNLRILWFTLASICAGLAFGSRPTCVFLNFVLIALWLYLASNEYKLVLKQRFVWESLALFLPSLAACLTIAWYNYARFGDIFQFGVAYQLNGGEYHRYQTFQFSYIPDSIMCYFLQPGNFGPIFPYVDTECYNHYDALWPDRFRLPCSGIFPAFPITLLAFAWPFYVKAQLPEKRDHIRIFGFLLSLWAIVLTTVVCMFFSVIHHYAAEPLFALILLTTLTLLMRRQKSPFYLWEKIILFLLFTYSFYFGILYGLTGDTHWIQTKMHDLYGWNYG